MEEVVKVEDLSAPICSKILEDLVAYSKVHWNAGNCVRFQLQLLLQLELFIGTAVRTSDFGCGF